MYPGTILRHSTKPDLFLLVLYRLLIDKKDRMPVVLLSSEPFLRGNVLDQIYGSTGVYYLLPVATWADQDHLKRLEPVDTVAESMVTKVVSVDESLIEQLALILQAGK